MGAEFQEIGEGATGRAMASAAFGAQPRTPGHPSAEPTVATRPRLPAWGRGAADPVPWRVGWGRCVHIIDEALV